MHASSSDTQGGTVEVRQTSSPAWADTDRPDGICSADVGIEVYLFSDLADDKVCQRRCLEVKGLRLWLAGGG
jgi:hypothetical protein